MNTTIRHVSASDESADGVKTTGTNSKIVGLPERFFPWNDH